MHFSFKIKSARSLNNLTFGPGSPLSRCLKRTTPVPSILAPLLGGEHHSLCALPVPEGVYRFRLYAIRTTLSAIMLIPSNMASR